MGLDVTMDAAAGWTAILPVKALADAKSRLHVPAAPSLALAFLSDALAAVAATPTVSEIIVATSDPGVADIANAAGATVVDDTGHPGINAAAAHAARSRPATGGVVVMVSDLPCLTSPALATALRLATLHRTAFLPDLAGDGTTMWFSQDGVVATAFGPQSRAAHTALGCVDLATRHPVNTASLRAARCDVDTVAALDEARALGVGPATAAALRA